MLGSNTSRSGSFLLAGGAGLLIGLLANPLRKLAVQAPTMLKKNWDDALRAEHRATIALIDAIEETETDDVAKRTVLLTQLKHALGKHALQEENAIYPKMRERGLLEPAKQLNEEHGEIKRLLFDLTELDRADPQWIAKVHELRSNLETHMAAEEEELFPQLRAALSDSENEHLAVAMNREGLKLA
jgi:iron-sulfur cluster repair protein YtfE (RIC family)